METLNFQLISTHQRFSKQQVQSVLNQTIIPNIISFLLDIFLYVLMHQCSQKHYDANTDVKFFKEMENLSIK